MSDNLIRQSDAIKKIKWWFDLIKLNPDILIDSIITLPTIEPTEEFEWCHDCKEYDQEKHCCPRWTKVIRNTVAELEATYKPKSGEWIRSADIDIAWGSKVYRCSNCEYMRDSKTNFCPNCGASMTEREGE